MNDQAIIILLFSALSIGFVHTLLGPDHYIPFIVLAKTRKWSITKSIVITALCGIGHVLSAVILGIIAISFGFTLSKLNFIESFRGEMASWLLVGFGVAYFIWGMRAAIKNKKHSHFHAHSDGIVHTHNHGHCEEHAHVHTKNGSKELTPWVLFIIFILGPCEPLIPIIMYPAIQKSVINVFLITLVFGLATLFVMLSSVLLSVYGAKKILRFQLLERYGSALAGSIICSCGLAIKFFGV